MGSGAVPALADPVSLALLLLLPGCCLTEVILHSVAL